MMYLLRSGIVCILLCVLFSVGAAAQGPISTTTHAMTAARLCQEGKMPEAMEEVELAIVDETENKDMYTWYVRGFIYKEQYKLSKDVTTRETAVASFLKSKEMLGSDDEVTINHTAALKYLATTYYNDALQSATNMQTADDAEPEQLMQQFETLMRKVAPGKDVVQEYITYYTAKAQRLYELWNISKTDTLLFESCVQNFESVIALHPEDCTSKYNLGVLYYNKALSVHQDDSIEDNGSDSAQLSRELVQKATALIESANKTCPSEEYQHALDNCNRMLEMPVTEKNK
ncbi:MAG: hypothetical protein ACKVOR_04790 [Flavobacteriales bacterium]